VSTLLLLAVLAGCKDLTQVVVVLQSDLVVPTETDGIQTVVGGGPSPTDTGGFPSGIFGAGPLTTGFPLSFGVNSVGMSSSFSFNVQLMKGFNSGQPTLIVVHRTVTDVRFVDDQTMMLVVPLMRVCACQGTSCPAPGNPACDAIDQPALQPFDPAVAPPSVMGGGGVGNFTPPVRQSAPAPTTGESAS
jgi:hypothetical protein